MSSSPPSVALRRANGFFGGRPPNLHSDMPQSNDGRLRGLALWQVAVGVQSSGMGDVTRLLDAVAAGDRQAAADLLPLVYEELRQLAAARMAAEAPGNTLQPTALVHEAYLRLVGRADEHRWDGRGHFFAAAAEAMRRILIESARRKHGPERGGDLTRLDLDPDQPAPAGPSPRLLALDEALNRLAAIE